MKSLSDELYIGMSYSNVSLVGHFISIIALTGFGNDVSVNLILLTSVLSVLTKVNI